MDIEQTLIRQILYNTWCASRITNCCDLYICIWFRQVHIANGSFEGRDLVLCSSLLRLIPTVTSISMSVFSFLNFILFVLQGKHLFTLHIPQNEPRLLSCPNRHRTENRARPSLLPLTHTLPFKICIWTYIVFRNKFSKRGYMTWEFGKFQFETTKNHLQSVTNISCISVVQFGLHNIATHKQQPTGTRIRWALPLSSLSCPGWAPEKWMCNFYSLDVLVVAYWELFVTQVNE